MLVLLFVFFRIYKRNKAQLLLFLFTEQKYFVSFRGALHKSWRSLSHLLMSFLLQYAVACCPDESKHVKWQKAPTVCSSAAQCHVVLPYLSRSDQAYILSVSLSFKGQIPLRYLVRSWSQTGSKLVRSWSQTCSELKLGLSSSLLAAN